MREYVEFPEIHLENTNTGISQYKLPEHTVSGEITIKKKIEYQNYFEVEVEKNFYRQSDKGIKIIKTIPLSNLE